MWERNRAGVSGLIQPRSPPFLGRRANSCHRSLDQFISDFLFLFGLQLAARSTHSGV